MYKVNIQSNRKTYRKIDKDATNSRFNSEFCKTSMIFYVTFD
jgi:hypothetical protein